MVLLAAPAATRDSDPVATGIDLVGVLFDEG
jgi:hypothetical protein